MTSYRTSGRVGRENARAATTGHRKQVAERITLVVEPAQEWVPPSPPFTATGFYRDHPTRKTYRYALVGACGHELARVVSADERPPAALTRRLGRRMVCPHEDCVIPPRPPVPDDERCEYVLGVEVERRCARRARFDTNMGKVCKAHRDHYVREGYVAAGTEVPLT